MIHNIHLWHCQLCRQRKRKKANQKRRIRNIFDMKLLQTFLLIGFFPTVVCFAAKHQIRPHFAVRTDTSSTDFDRNIRSNAIQDSNNRQSAQDWLHNVASLPTSTVLRDVMNPVLTVTAWSLFVSISYKCLMNGSKTMQYIGNCMNTGTQFHSFLVSSLGLLLVFRTNSAYQRFVEGRKIWENILSISRNLSRLLTVYGESIDPKCMDNMKNMLAAFPYLLRYHIRTNCLSMDKCCKESVPINYRFKIHELPLKRMETRHEGDKNGGTVAPIELQDITPKNCWVDRREYPWRLFRTKDLHKCAMVTNRPLWVCDRLSKEIAKIPYGPNFLSRERLTMIGHVDKLSNCIGECERIHQTGVPLNYARHLLRSLTIWLLTLPFTIVKDVGLLTGPICGITAWIMLGIYQIGYSIEDPFKKSLRLSILCNTIREDITSGSDRYSAFASDKEHNDLIEGVPESQSKTSLIELIEKGKTNQKNRAFDLEHKSAPLLPYDPIMSDMLVTISQSIKEDENWPLSQNRELNSNSL